MAQSEDLRPQQIDLALARSLVPPRPNDSHKGTFGHLLVVAGSVGYTGAACLVCEAALRAGVGIVTLGIPASLNPIVETKLTETITLPLPETPAQTLSSAAGPPLASVAERCQAAVVGPGLARDAETGELVAWLAHELPLPLVIDADGLNLLAERPSLLGARPAPTVLTPHPGEMARLTGLKTSAIQAERQQVAARYARETGAIVVLKGWRTVCAAPDGSIRINTTGNPGMATAGSGDVLAGVIGALLAQRLDPFAAATLGVFLHGLAGDLAAERLTPQAMVAGDILRALPDAWHKLLAATDDVAT